MSTIPTSVTEEQFNEHISPYLGSISVEWDHVGADGSLPGCSGPPFTTSRKSH